MSRARRRRLAVTLSAAVCLLVGGVFWAPGPASSPGDRAHPPELSAWAAGAAAMWLVAEGDVAAPRATGSRAAGPAADGLADGARRAGGTGRPGAAGTGAAGAARDSGGRAAAPGAPGARPPAGERPGGAARGPARATRPLVPRAPISRARPSTVTIPALRLDAPVVGLGLDRHGRLTTPAVDAPRVAGWYERGPSPGERGTAIIVGHRDTRRGPAVFLELPTLRRGDLIEVARHDGRTAVFTVDAVRAYPRSDFPDHAVYGDAGRPELRLLTCGGPFEPGRGYRSNVVVFAHLYDVRDAARAR
ncbi:class F sortase [Streptomyces sp. 71268]|uniref:class F sortase n=1 Tax=Streptomyces sp. 71268 TaxID=3002640 RepID=UPI0023F6A43C|nr:class F sortase [Streptomyces sp. 71268]WEV24642.1 class F sortase [Streptomyces sp. 71268]